MNTKKPYELKAEHSKQVLDAFIVNSTPEYQMLFNALLAFWNGSADQKTGSIRVSVGKRGYWRGCNCFNAFLVSCADQPNVVIGTWGKSEPTMSIGVSNRRINHILCSLNLTLISDLETKEHGHGRYTFTFKYADTIDYQLDIMQDE